MGIEETLFETQLQKKSYNELNNSHQMIGT